MTKNPIAIADIDWAIGEHVDGLFVRKDQDITPQFLNDCATARFESNTPSKDLHHIAAIPVVVVEKWLSEGFDIYQETPRAILRRLREESLDSFITTNKRI